MQRAGAVLRPQNRARELLLGGVIIKAAWGYLFATGLALAATSCQKDATRAPAPESGALEAGLVKPPNVAGAFYPGDAGELSAAVVVAVVTPSPEGEATEEGE